MYLLFTVFAQADDQINLSARGQFAGLQNITIGGIVSALVTLIMVLAALIFFFILIWGGIKYITAGGDKAQTESARSQITAAMIGLMIVFASWAILNLMSIFFGVNLLELAIPNAQRTPAPATGDAGTCECLDDEIIFNGCAPLEARCIEEDECTCE